VQLGLPFCLFITFLILKLLSVITWSWVWVTAPLWVGLLLVLPILIILACLLVASAAR
jgi:hypothetical protein